MSQTGSRCARPMARIKVKPPPWSLQHSDSCCSMHVFIKRNHHTIPFQPWRTYHQQGPHGPHSPEPRYLQCSDRNKTQFWRSPSLFSLERALRNLFSSRQGILDGRRPTSNANVSRRFLAATAIGTKVKFWKYDAPDLQLESNLPTLAPNSEVLDLSQARGQTEAIQMLAYVRNEGFDWTESGEDGTH
ncbi:uncharacterized protein BO95DRAFT_45168 [Aspergillus brunneoviolaceus CBS 621.78]|uniref:Uncharacterized protein n=1 Tax=Aspergillus brunneoviolaceus CBS 621.78 TaxID=1450534 RepID=A0ACD1GHS5_9EURO|nr:hypothetical protein BO95DRAFT_45168 [Aspergillus brunneoviolaceus CBS 621.78]RAH48715.1 hypothetical protein BO95DRAFT_45168 [Aspergillus brunneoviolaceus CBS 621.78]